MDEMAKIIPSICSLGYVLLLSLDDYFVHDLTTI